MTETATVMPIKKSRPAPRHPGLRGGSRPVERLRTEVDRLLDDFLRGYWHVPFRKSVVDVEPYWRGQISIGAVPAVDIVDKADAYQLTAELPGVDEHGVEIGFSDGTLTIKGQKQEAAEDEKQDHFLSERYYGAFQRSFRVPNGVDADKIAASYRNGILTVTLSKTAEARKQAKKIAVTST